MNDAPDLDQEMDCLLERLPDGAARVMRKARAPEAAVYRIPVGVALTIGGVLGFLPLLGFWMTPLGLAVLAQDVPPLRRPVARLVRAVNRKLPNPR
jgi:hypothetical protein